jgi:transcriptional regulator with XRE-family HTH domain
MAKLGAQLRLVRIRKGLSLRQVEKRCAQAAEESAVPAWRIPAGWLDRVESENSDLSPAKLSVLSRLYELSEEDVLALNQNE